MTELTSKFKLGEKVLIEDLNITGYILGINFSIDSETTYLINYFYNGKLKRPWLIEKFINKNTD